MKYYIIIKLRKCLPKLKDIIDRSWKAGIQFSRVADEVEFKDSTFFEFGWDKWLDDKRWSGNKHSNNLLSFDISKNIDNYNEPILAEADDNILFIDKRALYRAILLIAESSEGKISEDKKNWITPEEFHEKYKEYIDSDFDEAVEKSLESTKTDI